MQGTIYANTSERIVCCDYLMLRNLHRMVYFRIEWQGRQARVECGFGADIEETEMEPMRLSVSAEWSVTG